MHWRGSSLLALGVVALAFGCTRSAPSQSAQASARASTGSPQALPVTFRADTVGWKLGERYPYKLSLSSNVAMGGPASAFDFELSADLVVLPTAVTDSSTSLLLALRNWKLVSHVANTQPDFDKLAAEGETSGAVVVLSGGRVSELQFASDESGVIAGIYREIGSYLQFATTTNGESQYQAEEWDTTGQYVADYHRAGESGNWQRRKLRYLGILGAQRAATLMPIKIVPAVLASDCQAQLLASGRPGQIHAHDELAISGTQVPVNSKTTLTLEAGPSAAAGALPDLSAEAKRLVKVAVDQPFGTPGSIDALDDARIHGLTYAKVTQQLLGLADAEHAARAAGASVSVAAQQSIEQRQQLFVALAALFRRNPETVPQAVAQVRAKSPISEVLLDALGSSGSGAAQEALAQLANDQKLEPKVRERALMALARTPRPSDAAIAALKAQLEKDPFKTGALYGLGTYARHLRDSGDTEKMTSIGDYLVQRLADARNVVPYLLAVLGAIMNSGYDRALPAVTPFLSDAREPVRVAAVRSLQSMQSSQINGLLAGALQSDASSDVQISAIDAARVREPDDTLTHALSGAATQATDARVRYRAVDLIVQWLPKRADLRSTLAVVASNDKEPSVRARAQAAL
jgi:Lipoprotein amino terminal region